MKIVKVELEEEESIPTFWKTVIAAIGLQILCNLLYSHCQRRNQSVKSTKTGKIEASESEDETSK